MLRSFWLTFVLLAMAPAIATAQSAPQTVQVDKAQATVTTAEQKVTALLTSRAQLSASYQQQLTTIDRLKKQKASWRRDRELNTAQANANDTAKKLTALDKQLITAQQALLKVRKQVVASIDAEVAAGASGARAEQLAKLRNKLAPPAPPAKKIVIPDAEIDPLADPQELEQQAAALAAVEKQLESQRKGLDTQHRELQLVADARSAHDRAGELSTRDDDQPQRGTPRSSGGGREVSTSADGASPQSPPSGGGAGSGAGGGGGTAGESNDAGGSFGGDKLSGTSTFETSAAVALGEVIDRSTIDGLVRASRSGDPKQRAEAARLARDAVAKRLEQLKKKRAIIEARAKSLRGK